jgi:hypothetical protein
MTEMNNKVKVLHPILMGLYPVVALAAYNIEEIVLQDVIRSVLFSLVFAVFLWVFLYLITRNLLISGLICTYLLFLYYSYGHVYHLIETQKLFGIAVGRPRFLIPIWLTLLVGGIWLILQTSNFHVILTKYLNVLLLIVFLFPLIDLTRFKFQQYATISSQSQENGIYELGDIDVPNVDDLPDIYYIVLDEYTRGDTLKDVYGYDNEPFLTSLEELGFVVPRCSQSNYAGTHLSMGSSLNLDYVENLGYEIEPSRTGTGWLSILIEYSKTRSYLEEIGYTFVAFETGVPWADQSSADIYLKPEVNSGGLTDYFGLVNEFDIMYLESSAGLLFKDLVTRVPDLIGGELDQSIITRRDIVLYTLEKLDSLPETEGPKFVHAHMMVPHFPAIFSPEGEFISTQPLTYQAKLDAYRDHVIYINSRLLPIVLNILEDSEIPPMIIIQGDHGPRRIEGADSKNHQLRILNAYYFPENIHDELYPTITPVNTFRLLFNSLIEAEFPLLEDISYWSHRDTPFDFTVIPNECESLFQVD